MPGRNLTLGLFSEGKPDPAGPYGGVPGHPKGPRGPLWVNLQTILDPMGAALRWRRRYGDPMTYPPFDGKPMLITGSPAGLSAIFGAPPELFEQALIERIAAVFGDSSVLVLSGARHAAMRKLLMPPFHGQRMRDYAAQLYDLTQVQARGLQPGACFVAQDLMHGISMQAIIQLVFGVTDPERIQQVAGLIEAFRHAFARSILPILFPWLRRDFWGFGPWARLMRATRALREVIDQGVDESRAAQSAPRERTDILSLLVAARHDDGSALDSQQIFEQMLTLLLAGHTTTAIAMAWALYFLAREPHVQRRVQAELQALGPDPDPKALAKAPYLEAVCNETLRLRPAVPMMGRKLRGPLTVAGCELPAGAIIFGSIVWAHYNPEVFPEPERFLPERFLDRTYSPFEFFPLGGGSRRCIGAAFALYEMKGVLGTLLQRFSFEPASDKPVRVVQRDFLVPGAPIRLIVRRAAAT